jgi:hypothetical protein
MLSALNGAVTVACAPTKPASRLATASSVT